MELQSFISSLKEKYNEYSFNIIFKNNIYITIEIISNNYYVKYVRNILLLDIQNNLSEIFLMISFDIERKLHSIFDVIFCGNNAEIFYKDITYHKFIHLPLTKIEKLNNQLDTNMFEKKYDYIVISSKNAFNSNHVLKNLNIKNWIAVGPQTKIYLQNYITKNILVPEIYNAIGVVSLIQNKSLKEIHNLSILWVGAANGIIEGIEQLRTMGASVDIYQPYQNIIILKEELELQRKNIEAISKQSIWIFTSPSCVESYLYHNLYNNKHIICCIGKTTASIFYSKNIIPYYIANQSELLQIKKDLFQEV